MKSKFFTLTTLVSFSLSPLAFTAEAEKAVENAKPIISLEDFQRHLAELSAEEEAEIAAEEIPTIQEEEQVAALEETPLPEATPLEELQASDASVIDPLLDAPDTYQLDAEFMEEPEEPVTPYEVQPAPQKGLSITQTRTRQNILLALIAIAVAITAIVLVSKNQGCDAHKDHDNHH